jgi:hypothetical protein
VNYFYYLSTALSTLFIVGAMQAMLAGAWKKYPVLFAYLCFTFSLSAPMSIAFLVSGATWTGVSRSAYWILSLSMQLCGVLLLLTLTHRAGQHRADIRRTVTLLSIGFLLALIGSSAFHYPVALQGLPNRWMTFVSRDIAFVSTLMNLVLWSFLVGNRKRDQTVLLISAGLGLQCTIDAMGHALRFFPNEVRDAGNLVISAGSILTSYVWYRIFQPAPLGAPPRVRTNP